MPREGDTELTGGPWGPGGPGVSDEQAQEEGKAGHVSPSLWKKRNNLLNGPPPLWISSDLKTQHVQRTPDSREHLES